MASLKSLAIFFYNCLFFFVIFFISNKHDTLSEIQYMLDVKAHSYNHHWKLQVHLPLIT